MYVTLDSRVILIDWVISFGVYRWLLMLLLNFIINWALDVSLILMIDINYFIFFDKCKLIIYNCIDVVKYILDFSFFGHIKI